MKCAACILLIQVLCASFATGAEAMRNPNRLRTSRQTSACALARTERPLPPRMATLTHPPSSRLRYRRSRATVRAFIPSAMKRMLACDLGIVKPAGVCVRKHNPCVNMRRAFNRTESNYCEAELDVNDR